MSIETVQPDSGIQKLGKLISGIKVAMLTTEDHDGCLHSRPMATLNPTTNQMANQEFDGSLWFFCTGDSGKTEEIQNHKKVNLAYASPENHRYISVAGIAEIVKDQSKISELWNPSYAVWFPRGVQDAVLIRVGVESAQYWELPHGPVTHLKGFIKAVKSGKTYNPQENGENGKFRIA
jgi:general stress protein 26